LKAGAGETRRSEGAKKNGVDEWSTQSTMSVYAVDVSGRHFVRLGGERLGVERSTRMSAFVFASELYRDGRVLVQATRSYAMANDLVRWTREDLEDALLDLKLAVIDQDLASVQSRGREVNALTQLLYGLIEGLDEPPAEGW
jgi:hypothetical protein